MKIDDVKLWILPVLASAAVACGDDEGPSEEAGEEVITTVRMTFTPEGSGNDVVATFRDPDGEGGDPPVQFDDIVFVNGTTYTMTIELQNETVDPADPEFNIGNEIAEEAEEHQFFFTGSAVDSEATGANPSALVQVRYDDLESDYADAPTDPDLPVGLQNTVEAVDAGSADGGFEVTLKHLPPVGGQPQKTPSSTVDGPGGIDVDLAFDLTVQ